MRWSRVCARDAVRVFILIYMCGVCDSLSRLCLRVRDRRREETRRSYDILIESATTGAETAKCTYRRW